MVERIRRVLGGVREQVGHDLGDEHEVDLDERKSVIDAQLDRVWSPSAVPTAVTAASTTSLTAWGSLRSVREPDSSLAMSRRLVTSRVRWSHCWSMVASSSL